jgi:hypothetical protein
MKSLLIGAIAAATLATGMATAQTPPGVTGQQAVLTPGSPGPKTQLGVKQPGGNAQTPTDAPTEFRAGEASKAQPGSGPLSSVVTPGIDPDTNDGMYLLRPVADTSSAPN